MFQTSDILKKRVYALTIDFFIVVVANYFLMASFTNFVKTVFFHFPLRAQLFFINKLGLMSSVSLMSLTFAYFSIFYFATNGKTMGKTLFGLKVISPSGEVTLKQAMQRSIAYFLCAMFGSFLFALSFIRRDGKSLADITSSTTVVLEDKITSPLELVKETAGTEFQLTLVDAIQENDEAEAEYFEQNKAA